MSRVAKFARRTFLVGSAGVAGGVAFGYYYAKKSPPNPLLDDLAEGEAAITPFVRIDGEGVTFITPRADLGQGAYSIQASLIAEELDIDPHTVKTDPGQPHQAYYNRAVLEGAGPFPAYDSSWPANLTRGALGTVGKALSMQMTGGSTTVPDMYERLRAAGAVARETLKKAASVEHGVDVAQLKTADGAVVLPSGERVPYTALAIAASKIPPVTDVTLRDPAQWTRLGKKVRRTDIVAKSTGTQKYGIDLALEGMVHATVRTNPGLGGPMTSFDASKATSMRGVKEILEITNGVAVVADNTWRAFRAANAIDIEWGPAPYPKSSAEMWSVLENAIRPEYLDSRMRDDGDVESALSGAEVVEAEYRTPYLAHAPLEPMNAIVQVGEDRVDIWTGTQIPAFLRDHAAARTGVDPSRVFIWVQPMGGSFGRRLEHTYALQALEIAQKLKGTPVKMTWSREEDMTHDYPRPLHYAKCRGAVKDGRVEAYDLDSVSPSMSRSWFGRVWQAPVGPDATVVLGAWDQPFAIPHYRVTGYTPPELVPVSSWRAPGANSNGFFHESFLDELIHAAGADPLQERLRLCHHDLSRKVLEAVGEMSGWDGPKLGEGRGRGVAFTLSHGVPTAEVVEVTMTEGGIRVDKVFVAAEVGKVLDPVNFEAQLFGGVIWALGHSINCELTYEDYAPQQTNYHAYEGLRLYQTPEIVVRGLENGQQVLGAGEPAVPPLAPALANAIFAATGRRIREMPMNRHIDFV